MEKTINLGVIGIDHGHIFDMLDEMLKEGCTCDYFWTEGDPSVSYTHLTLPTICSV